MLSRTIDEVEAKQLMASIYSKMPVVADSSTCSDQDERGNEDVHKEGILLRKSEVYERRDTTKTAISVSSSSKQAGVRKRSRHNRIRHLGGSIGSHSDHSHNGFSTEIAGAMGCDRKWDLEPLGVSAATEEDSCVDYMSFPVALVEPSRRRGRMRPIKDLIEECCQSLRSQSGQSTVEFAIVFVALLCVLAGIGLLMNAVESGMFVDHAIASASHNASIAPGGMVDVFSY